jgi:hypothetical protein
MAMLSRSANLLRLLCTGILTGWLFFSLQAGESYSQPLPAIDHKAGKENDFLIYYRKRVVEIVVTGFRKKDGTAIDVVHGTGFVASAAGEVITAGHVIEFANSDEYVVRVQVYLHDGHHHVDVLEGVPKSYQISKFGDIGLFKIKSDGVPDFSHVCIDKGDPKLRPSNLVTVATTRYLSGKYDEADFTVTPGRHIAHPVGPGNMYQYIGIEFGFQNSMSGGAVIRDSDDKVIGVISNTLTQDGRELQGDSYVSLLRAATDIGIQSIAECEPEIPGEKDLQRTKSQKEFMSGTCEGTVAWVPDGIGGEYWYFAESANYKLSRKDLPKCVGGNDGDKLLRFVINHNTDGKCSRGNDACGFATGIPTFYGVQVVPIINEGEEGVVEQGTWLYKNSVLLARSSRGGFYTPADQSMPKPESLEGVGPNDFNTALHEASTAVSTRQENSCGRNFKPQECADVLGVKKLEQKLGLKRPWQGYTRKDHNPQSTLQAAGEAKWRVRSDWISAGKDLQVKNWILRYMGTVKNRSLRPVDFSFCIPPQWKEFYLRTFSPERCAESKLIHVFVSN